MPDGGSQILIEQSPVFSFMFLRSRPWDKESQDIREKGMCYFFSRGKVPEVEVIFLGDDPRKHWWWNEEAGWERKEAGKGHVIRLVMTLSNWRVFCPGTLGTCRPYLRTIPAETWGSWDVYPSNALCHWLMSPSLGWENPLEKGKTTHSSFLAWRIP